MSKELIEECKRGKWRVKDYRSFFEKNPKANVNTREFITQMGPLHYSCRQGSFSIVKLLIEKGAKLDPKSTWTPLHIASYNEHTDVVRLLCKHGANVHASTRWYSYTPLHFACENDDYETVSALLDFKADPKKKAKGGKTCLDLCRNARIVDLLKDYFRAKKEEGQGAKTEVFLSNIDLNFDKRALVWLDCGIDEKSVPIVYREENNISFLKIQELHPFDSTKFEKIAKFLVEDGTVKNSDFYIKSKSMTNEFLLKLHTEKYIESLNTSLGVAGVVEFPPAAIAPYFLVKNVLVTPMLFQAGGTVLAGEIAMKYGWAINLGGGMHHASSAEGGGWCAYGDIQLSIINLREGRKVKKAMIIDLDAHQGNGYENDVWDGLLGPEEDNFIVDIYNYENYPHDDKAKGAINVKVELEEGTGSDEYIEKLTRALKRAFRKFQPDVVFYNAGTDILENDPLGALNVSEEAVILRDYLVFEKCISNDIPIVMVTSGGYQKTNARVIASSIRNLYEKLGLEKIAKENFEKNLKSSK